MQNLSLVESSVDTFFYGSRHFWRYKRHIDFLIISHSHLHCLEIITSDTTSGLESTTRQYVDEFRLASKISYEDINNQISSLQSDSWNRNSDLEGLELRRQALKMLMAQYLLNRAHLELVNTSDRHRTYNSPRDRGDCGHSSNSPPKKEVLRVVIRPMVGDLVRFFDNVEQLDVLCPKPIDLKPFITGSLLDGSPVAVHSSGNLSMSCSFSVRDDCVLPFSALNIPYEVGDSFSNPSSVGLDEEEIPVVEGCDFEDDSEDEKSLLNWERALAQRREGFSKEAVDTQVDSAACTPRLNALRLSPLSSGSLEDGRSPASMMSDNRSTKCSVVSSKDMRSPGIGFLSDDEDRDLSRRPDSLSSRCLSMSLLPKLSNIDMTSQGSLDRPLNEPLFARSNGKARKSKLPPLTLERVSINSKLRDYDSRLSNSSLSSLGSAFSTLSLEPIE